MKEVVVSEKRMTEKRLDKLASLVRASKTLCFYKIVEGDFCYYSIVDAKGQCLGNCVNGCYFIADGKEVKYYWNS